MTELILNVLMDLAVVSAGVSLVFFLRDFYIVFHMLEALYNDYLKRKEADESRN